MSKTNLMDEKLNIIDKIKKYLRCEIQIERVYKISRKQKDNLYWKIWVNEIKGILENEYFKDAFERAYTYSYNKKRKNKRYNMLFKKLYAWIIIAYVVALFVLLYFFIFCNSDILNLIVVAGTLLVILLLLLFAIGKQLDINKYQETWSRHSKTLFKYDSILLKSCLKLKKLQTSNNKINVADDFVLQIMSIFEENQRKFNDNLENKEVRIQDDVNIGTILNHFKK